VPLCPCVSSSLSRPRSCCIYLLFWTGVGGCCRKTMARPDNLAQASQSRLGEIERDSPKPFLRERSPELSFWASERLAQAREVSPRWDPRELLFLLFEPSPRRRGLAWAKPLAWARPFNLSEELGETVWLCGCFWNSEMVYACLDVD